MATRFSAETMSRLPGGKQLALSGKIVDEIGEGRCVWRNERAVEEGRVFPGHRDRFPLVIRCLGWTAVDRGPGSGRA